MIDLNELKQIAYQANEAGQGSPEIVEFRVTATPDAVIAMINQLEAAQQRIASDIGGYVEPVFYGSPPAPSAPDGWIKCSDRMPYNVEGSVKYLVYETLNERVNHDYWNVPDQWSSQVAPFWNHYGEYVTHWMPLPAAPGGE